MSWSMSVAMALAIVAFGPRDARGDTKDGGVMPEWDLLERGFVNPYPLSVPGWRSEWSTASRPYRS